MNKYRVGIVGLRGIAASLADPAPHWSLGSAAPHSHASCYAVMPNTEVVAVCDLDTELADGFVSEWRNVWENIATYSDYREMLSQQKLDILSVVTSDHRHADIVVDAADAGVQAIYCEKPLATTLADADRMIEAVERANVAMTVNHSRRWWPEFHQAKQILNSYELGLLKQVTVIDCSPRSMIFRNGSHWIDLINFFIDSAPQWVIGRLDAGHEQYGAIYRGDGGRDAAAEPGAIATIQYENGITAFYCGTKATTRFSELQLICEHGRIRMQRDLVEIETADGLRRLGWPQYERSDGVAAIHELIEQIEKGKPVLSPPREARKAVEIILAILRSQHEGNSRIDLPITDYVQEVAANS
jgi:predicted dehydrogenase